MESSGDETNPEETSMKNLAFLLFHKMKNDGVLAELERLEEQEDEEEDKKKVGKKVVKSDHSHSLCEKNKEKKEDQKEPTEKGPSLVPSLFWKKVNTQTSEKRKDNNSGKRKEGSFWSPPSLDDIYKRQAEKVLKDSRLEALQKETAAIPMLSVRQKKKLAKGERAMISSRGWGGMHTKEEPTDQEKMDLMVLKMRSTIDTQRHYKHTDIQAPKFFQFGTVVGGAHDFHHRVPKKKQKTTMVEELMADMEFRKQNKKKYLEIVETKHQGKAAYQSKPPKRKKKTKAK